MHQHVLYGIIYLLKSVFNRTGFLVMKAGRCRAGFPLFIVECIEKDAIMNAKDIVKLVTQIAEPITAQVGCEVWDVKFVREAGQWVLRVLIDTVVPGNVSIDMCEEVNRALDQELDRMDPIEQSYVLEVGSPGIERELYRPSDFDKYKGSMVDIKLYAPMKNGEKKFTAKLIIREDDKLVLEKDGEEIVLPLSSISKCNVHFDFSSINKKK